MLEKFKNSYVAGARGLGKALVATRVLPNEPPDRYQRVKHWISSLPSIYDSVALLELEVPWWPYAASEYVEAWLAERRGGARIFEWGTGASTAWFAKRAAQVVTVEHHAEFAAMIAERLGHLDNVDFRHVPALPSTSPRVTSGRDGHGGLDFFDYVNSIDDAEGQFDLIAIDGRARETCLVKAVDRLAPDGMILFDNSRRRRYRDAIERSGLVTRKIRGLTPSLPYPDQTTLLTKP